MNDYGRVFCVLLSAAASCTTSSRTAGDAAAVDAASPPPAASSSSIAKEAGVAPDSIVGEWERQTEPYKGMRVSIGAGVAVVTLPPPVTQERLSSQARSASSPAAAKAQLECQRSLWKPGDELITGARPENEGGFNATILIRDWGFTGGACRHADSHAPARLVVSSAGDELTVTVTRGKMVTPQQWSRVAR